MNYIFNFFGNVNNEIVANSINAISNFQEPESLMVNINSQGGEIPAAIAFYNYLKSLPYPVNTHNLSEVASSAILNFLLLPAVSYFVYLHILYNFNRTLKG